ncbi:MAG: hypothetical protein U5J83_01895 [Bryobacterales bacterium]|nr:hypothetical protein [Bryobacterales bacterium]
MGTCEIYFLALGMIVLGDVAIMLNAHRFVKAPADDSLRHPEAGSSPRNRQLAIIRFAIGMSLVTVVGIFLYLLAQKGCLV